MYGWVWAAGIEEGVKEEGGNLESGRDKEEEEEGYLCVCVW